MARQLVLAAADRLMGRRREDDLQPVDQGPKQYRIVVVGLLDKAHGGFELGKRRHANTIANVRSLCQYG